MRIAVIGAGTAGPAAALFLARQGHEVEVHERAPALLPVGTGFVLQPSGLAVLEALGLRDRALAHGAKIDELHCRTHGGRVVLDLSYARLATGAHGVGMHRATLLQILVDALVREGAVLHTGSAITGSMLDAAGRWLQRDGERLGPFDLVIVAAGARAESRAWTGIPHRAKRYPWGALWTIVPDRDRRFDGRLLQIVEGSHTMLGFLPTGSRADDPDATPLVSLFWSLREDRLERTRAAPLSQLLDAITRLAPGAAPLLDAIPDMEAWSFAGYMDVVMQRWHGDRCVVLGDAAHAMSPQLGQGVNLALRDAAVLADCIAQHPSLPDALSAYTLARRSEIGFYQRVTRWLTPLFQSRIPGAAVFRDAAMPVGSAFPPIERQMLRGMAGLKRGFLARSSAIAPEVSREAD